jgi:hypothetical protein
VNLVDIFNYVIQEHDMNHMKNLKGDYFVKSTSLFNCSSCKGEIDIFEIKTKKHVDDLHEKFLCTKCSDSQNDKSLVFKKRRKIISEN